MAMFAPVKEERVPGGLTGDVMQRERHAALRGLQKRLYQRDCRSGHEDLVAHQGCLEERQNARQLTQLARVTTFDASATSTSRRQARDSMFSCHHRQ